MKPMQILKTWMLAGLVALFLSACATSTEEEIADGAPVDGGSDSGAIVDSGSTDTGSGAEATGIDDGDSGDGMLQAWQEMEALEAEAAKLIE